MSLSLHLSFPCTYAIKSLSHMPVKHQVVNSYIYPVQQYFPDRYISIIQYSMFVVTATCGPSRTKGGGLCGLDIYPKMDLFIILTLNQWDDPEPSIKIRHRRQLLAWPSSKIGKWRTYEFKTTTSGIQTVVVLTVIRWRPL